MALGDKYPVVYVDGDVPQRPIQLGQLLVDSSQISPGATNLQQCTSQNPLVYEPLQGGYLETAAEIAAFVTVVNYLYPPGDIRRYGARVDGTTDDSAALQMAINQNAEANGADVFIPKGVVIVGQPTEILANVNIRGAGQYLSTIRAEPGSGGAVATIFYASGVDGWELSEMTLDPNVYNTLPSSSLVSLFVSGCSDWRVSNVHSVNAGRSAASPLGQHFWISVSEPGENASGSVYDVAGLPCFNWVISGCTFDDAGFACEFGVRVYSEFTLTINDDQFTIFNSGIIENCYFKGFMWNPIELAGPAVRFCKVVNCHLASNSQCYGSFEIDKGASWNKIISCSVIDVDMVKTDQCAYRVQGYPATGPIPTRTAIGNMIIGCSVRGMDGDNTNYPLGLWINIADRTTVIGFDVEDCTDGGGNVFSAAIRVDDAQNTTIVGGTWSNVVGGVYLGPSSETGDTSGLLVMGVNATTDYRFYTTSGTPTRRRIKFDGNIINLNNQVGFSVSNDEEIDITNNYLQSAGGGAGNTGVNISSTAGRTKVAGNTFNSFNIGIDYSGGSAINVVARENTFSSCTVNVSGSNSVRNSQNGNYATAAGGGTRTETFGAAAPVAGAWYVGDIVWNNAPAAAGTMGWVCTTAGSPGTWKTFGAIAP